MTRNLKGRIAVIVLIVGSAFWLAFPLKDKIRLGLDLQGGMHLVLKVETASLSREARDDARERALEIIRNRVDQFGVAEPSIQLQGKNRIIVQLPGIEERQRAIDLIGRTALLEFKLVAPDALTGEVIAEIDKLKSISDRLETRTASTREGVSFKETLVPLAQVAEVEEIISAEEVKGLLPADYEFRWSRIFEEKEKEYKKLFLVKKEPEIRGISLTGAQKQMGTISPYIVKLEFDSRGRRQMARVTSRAEKNYREEQIVSRLAIVLDGVIYSAPYMAVRVDTSPIIEGDFSREEAEDLAIVLRAGALPAPIVVEEERSVGPTLGRDSISAGVRAVIVGGILVLTFMTVYYLFSGLIANVALCLNLIIILGALSYFDATLTLPGIAGILLTVGMAVDANVLIFERIREEMRAGKNVRPAIAAGYQKAFLTILDANVTTLITAAILYWKGSGPIRGFAVTLGIGIIASMFTALVVTRLIFDLVSLERKFRRLRFLQLLREPKIDFIGKRRGAYALSALVILIGVVSFSLRRGKNFGIDFTGGTIQQFHFQQPVELDQVRDALGRIDLADASVQHFGSSRELIIRTEAAVTEEIAGVFQKVFPDNPAEVVRVEKVGPTVGRELKLRALWALLGALLAICLYISFRFEFRFAIAAIVALFHDCLVSVGILSLLGRELSLPVVAALLTVVGYSINDTIVVFDRIREDMRMMRREDFGIIINTAINQTLGRTLLTSLTTLLVVISLYFLGGRVINDFAFVLLVGVITGTYSSIFIASPILLDWHSPKKS